MSAAGLTEEWAEVATAVVVLAVAMQGVAEGGERQVHSLDVYAVQRLFWNGKMIAEGLTEKRAQAATVVGGGAIRTCTLSDMSFSKADAVM